MESPKYPRVVVSSARHRQLASEAEKKGVSISELAEEKFKATEKPKKK